MYTFSHNSQLIITELIESFLLKDCYIRNIQDCLDMNIIKHLQRDIFLSLKPLTDKNVFYN